MKQRVLFLCTGNSARSQMAEAFVRYYAAGALEPHSAGLDPRGLNPLAVRVMREAGIDMSGQESKSVRRYLGKMYFSHAITVCGLAERRCPRMFPWVENLLYWPFEDPAACQGSDQEKLAKFREIRDQIDARVQAWLAHLTKEDDHLRLGVAARGPMRGSRSEGRPEESAGRAQETDPDVR